MRLAPVPHVFPPDERAVIDAHFAARQRANPALWNGQVLVLESFGIDGGVLAGRYTPADFASLLWVLEGPQPHAHLRNCFAMGALRGADGGFVMARMAPWTANAGKVYFAAGTPDAGDVTPDGRVDLEGSLLRELFEETGIAAGEVTPAPGWTAVIDRRRVALLREIVVQEEAAALAARLTDFAARETRPEIDAAVVVRGPQDLPEGAPPFIGAYLAAVWGRDRMEP
nr:NUDIX hydrolase [Ancylobacter koreensis]